MTFGELIRSIKKNEWRFVLLLAGLMAVITTLPLVWGWLITPPGQEFTGGHLAMLNDWFVYYSYLEQARQGGFLFQDLFTTEPHAAVFNPFWLAVGLLGKYLHLSNILVFNLARIILIPVFLLLAYVFLALIFQESAKRKVALILLSFSSGAGWLLLDRLVRFPGNYEFGRLNWPMDLWVPELNTFATLYYSPHLVFSLILILLIFLLTCLFVSSQKMIYALPAGLASLLLVAFHPFHALTVFAVILSYFGLIIVFKQKIIWRLIWYYLILGWLSLPAVVYYGFLLKTDYVSRLKYIQNFCSTPPFWIVLFSLGFLGALAVLGVWLMVRGKIRENRIDQPRAFIAVWFLVQFCLLFAPVLFQRRLSEGLHFPLVVLSLMAWYYLYETRLRPSSRIKQCLIRQKELLFVSVLVALSISNIFLVAADLYIYASRKEFIYIDKKLIAGMDFIKNEKNNLFILNTAQKVVNPIPAFTGKTVYTGHGVETLFFFSKQKEVDWFFKTNRPENIELGFLQKRGIGYIFYTELEKSLGAYDPGVKTYLKLVFENEKVKIYRVK